jgi:hypothetical protein
MSKTIVIEFPAGTEVFVLHNNKPVSTIIRTAHYTNTLESKNEKTVEVDRTIYSTRLSPNVSLVSGQIGATEEELMKKLFPAKSEDKSEDKSEVKPVVKTDTAPEVKKQITNFPKS